MIKGRLKSNVELKRDISRERANNEKKKRKKNMLALLTAQLEKPRIIINRSRAGVRNRSE
jgi:hypothetical protein